MVVPVAAFIVDIRTASSGSLERPLGRRARSGSACRGRRRREVDRRHLGQSEKLSRPVRSERHTVFLRGGVEVLAEDPLKLPLRNAKSARDVLARDLLLDAVRDQVERRGEVAVAPPAIGLDTASVGVERLSDPPRRDKLKIPDTRDEIGHVAVDRIQKDVFRGSRLHSGAVPDVGDAAADAEGVFEVAADEERRLCPSMLKASRTYPPTAAGSAARGPSRAGRS